MLRFAFLAALAAVAHGQMQPQCQCSIFNPCAESAASFFQGCADRCQSHLTNLGASYPAARQCILSHMGQINRAVACGKAAFGQVCATRPGATVPRRFPETLQLAAFREINAMLSRSGILTEATALMQVGRRALGCMSRCGQQNSCVNKLKCGLALPSDNVIVQTSKNCALQAGFNTPVAREICNCLLNAGIRQLASICPRIVIT